MKAKPTKKAALSPTQVADAAVLDILTDAADYQSELVFKMFIESPSPFDEILEAVKREGRTDAEEKWTEADMEASFTLGFALGRRLGQFAGGAR